MATSFYRQDDNGLFICQVCQATAGHRPDCPLDRLEDQCADVMMHLGLFVANMRESLDTILMLLRTRDRDADVMDSDERTD